MEVWRSTCADTGSRVIEKRLSSERLSTYLTDGGLGRAVTLYEWNTAVEP